MRCEDCLSRLDEFLDGEVEGRDALNVRAHLASCASCSMQYESLLREREVYADFLQGVVPSSGARAALMSRIEMEAPPTRAGGILSALLGYRFRRLSWAGQRPAFAATLAVVVLLLTVAAFGLFAGREEEPQQLASATGARPSNEQPATVAPVTEVKERDGRATEQGQPKGDAGVPNVTSGPEQLQPEQAQPETKGTEPRRRAVRRAGARAMAAEASTESVALNGESVLPKLAPRNARAGELGAAAGKHFERTRLLLLAFKNASSSAEGEAFDVAYEKSLSRSLASRNALLRQEAGNAHNRPVEALLKRVEPLLNDIAQLPENASREDVESIRRRIATGEVLLTLRARSSDVQVAAVTRRD
jgi:anti-sigma factor RsiW